MSPPPTQPPEPPQPSQTSQPSQPAQDDLRSPDAAPGVPLPGDSVQRFLRDIEAAGALPEGISAAEAATAVLCTFGGWLGGSEASQEALPPSVRGLFARCARHREQPVDPGEQFDRANFLAYLATHLEVGPGRAEDIARAVLAAVVARLPLRDLDVVEGELPLDLKGLWRPHDADAGATELEDARIAAAVIASQSGTSPSDAGTSSPSQVATAPDLDPATRALLAALDGRRLLPPGISAMEAASAVLCTLAERMARGPSAQAIAAMPPVLSQIARRCDLHTRDDLAAGRAGFVRGVARHLDVDTEVAAEISRAVLDTLRLRLPAEEAHALERSIPDELTSLWRLPR